MLKLSHPTPGSHCRAISFAVHCTADGSFRQRWYSSLAERWPQESSFVGTGSVFLSAPSKACLGKQQQLQFTGTYSSSLQTAPAIPDGESLSSPASLEIPHVGLGKHLTCSSAHPPEICDWLSTKSGGFFHGCIVCSHEGYCWHREKNNGSILLGWAASQKPGANKTVPSSYKGRPMGMKPQNRYENIFIPVSRK